MSRRKQFIKDVSYIAAAKYSGIFVGIAISVVLARLLSPEDYGVLGLAGTFVAFFSLLGSFGFGSAIIQRHDLTWEDYKDIFGVTAWVGLFLAVMMFFSSPYIAGFYKNNTLTPVCRLLSLNLFISFTNSIPDSLLSKSKKFNVIAIRQLTIQVATGAISIFAAFAGWGVYALVLSSLSSSFLIFCTNLYYVRLPIHLLPSLEPIKKVFSFSFYEFLSGIVNYIGNNLSNLLIGKFLSLADVGNINKASSLAQMPVSNISGVINPVLFPYMAEINDDKERLYTIFVKLNYIFVTIGFLLSAILCVCSKEIILILYGDKWVSIIPCFALMTIVAATQFSALSIVSALSACGRAKTLFNMGVINSTIAFIGLLIGVFVLKSINGVALMGSLSATFSCINCIYLGYTRGFDKSPMKLFLYGLKCFIYYALLSALAYVFTISFPMNIVVSLIIKVFAWLIMSLVFIDMFTPFSVRTLVDTVKKVVKTRQLSGILGE